MFDLNEPCDCEICKPTPRIKTQVKPKKDSQKTIWDYLNDTSKYRSERIEYKGRDMFVFTSTTNGYWVATFEWRELSWKKMYINPKTTYGNDDLGENKTEEQKEQEMTAQIEQDRINYLATRLTAVERDKSDAAYKHFRLDNPSMPDTFPAVMEALKKGDFYFSSDEDENKKYLDGKKPVSSWMFSENIIWRNIKDKPDREGYHEAIKAIRAEKAKTLDVIKVLPADKGLEALNAFEAKTFH